ncbi:MAG TPA: hypothetical protein PLC87_11825 [Bacteroidales bacterium]|nr:hypothetical protein [Bacteroidales bacterium]
MSKLYVFGIGGTGARVLKSLTMLLAAGTDCDVETIVPIIIDRDISNKDLSRTKLLIEDYIIVNKIAKTNGNNKFFKTNIHLLNNELCLQLRDNTQKFDEFIGRSTMSNENEALVNMLFSKETLGLDMTEGFQGNPNIGSVVLNQFDGNDIFKAFASDFKDGDKIFIISSIFGGTGASGFPLLRRILHTPNVTGSDGKVLAKWGLINKAPIGAISVLPYFLVGSPTDGSLVDSDTFIDKARAALSYYKNEDKKIDVLYYIADKLTTTYEHHKGGDAQMNNAHFVELAAALAVLDFVNPEKSGINFHRDKDNNIERTVYKEFGINTNLPEFTFDNLSDETKRLIVNPLSRFLLFAKYMGFGVEKEQKNGKEKFVVKHIERNDIFKQENKYQPYSHKRFTDDFRKINSIQKLESVQLKFVEWLLEMELQNRRFAPFNLMSSNATDFIKGNMSVFKNDNSRYKNWSKIDNELNNQINKINKSMDNESLFIELFYNMTSEIINYKN